MNNPAPQSLSFLVKPASHRCNIACTYCFYARVHEIYGGAKPFMTEATLESLIRGALEVGAAHNTFCWQGGEPTLMGVDFFRRVRVLQETYRTAGQEVENSIQTNGLLLDSTWCRFLKSENFLVGISLDGPQHIHDHYRRDRKGKGTFDRVIRSIRMMEDVGVPFNILCLLTDANLAQPETVYRFFRKQRFAFLQFITCREVDAAGRPMHYSADADSVGRFYCSVFDLWMKDGFPEVSIRMFEDILLFHFEKIHASCCWMERCLGYLVVEHNGDCYPCDFFVYPRWRLGNLCREPLMDIWHSEKRSRFAQLKSDLPDECRSCEHLAFCNGDCTRFRGEGEPSGGRRSEYCSANRKLLAHMAASMPRIEKKVAALRAMRHPVESPGRNAPCPCGSGRKFKRCCGQ